MTKRTPARVAVDCTVGGDGGGALLLMLFGDTDEEEEEEEERGGTGQVGERKDGRTGRLPAVLWRKSDQKGLDKELQQQQTLRLRRRGDASMSGSLMPR